MPALAGDGDLEAYHATRHTSDVTDRRGYTTLGDGSLLQRPTLAAEDLEAQERRRGTSDINQSYGLSEQVRKAKLSDLVKGMLGEEVDDDADSTDTDPLPFQNSKPVPPAGGFRPADTAGFPQGFFAQPLPASPPTPSFPNGSSGSTTPEPTARPPPAPKWAPAASGFAATPALFPTGFAAPPFAGLPQGFGYPGFAPGFGELPDFTQVPGLDAALMQQLQKAARGEVPLLVFPISPVEPPPQPEPEPLPVPASSVEDAKGRATPPPATLHDDVTLMLRNIPNKYSQESLLEDLEEYRASVDFLYLPTDFKRSSSLGRSSNLGYAFLNFAHAAAAEAFVAEFNGRRLPRFPHSPKMLVVQCARVQGQAANIERFRSSSVMGVLDDHNKPMLFEAGVRVDFPAPQKAIPPPGARRKRRTAGKPA